MSGNCYRGHLFLIPRRMLHRITLRLPNKRGQMCARLWVAGSTGVRPPSKTVLTPLKWDVRAKLTDKHLASKIHCVDDEVIGWLERREQRRRDRHGSGSLSSDGNCLLVRFRKTSRNGSS